jgi:hypothetical protein
MEAVSGTAGAGDVVPLRVGVGVGVGVGRGVVRVGVGVAVIRVGVGVAVIRVGVGVAVIRVGVALGARRGPLRDGVGVAGVGAPLWAGDRVPFGVRGVPLAGALVVGELEARDGVLFERRSAGIAIPAPSTKNTAAMMNLDHCIASLSRRSANGAPGQPRSFFT